jgi:hypothetical protein
MQAQKELDDLRKSAGRINYSEYSKLPPTSSETPAQKQNRKRITSARNIAGSLGRVNATEYKALTAKKPVKRLPAK